MYYINYILRKTHFRNIKIKNISKKRLGTYSHYGGNGGGGDENYFFIPLILGSFYYFTKN
jgi:hypothetical protein